VKKQLVQYWHITNVPPARPMKKRRIIKPLALSTSPVQAVGIDDKQRTIENKTLAPYLSHSGPKRNRMKMVPVTPAIDELHISSFVNFNVCCISGRRGEAANQLKYAMKKLHHAQ
jgi:hypothetical protein